MKHLKRHTIKRQLKLSLITLLSVTLLLVSQACASNQSKTTRNIEAWKIDPYNLELYRKISPINEDVLNIKDNPDAERFMCIPSSQMPDLILEVNQ